MILKHAKRKLNYFNKTVIHAEAVYHYIIRRRMEIRDIYNLDFLDDITAGLISFDMQRMMGNEKYIMEGKKAWASCLRNALKPHRNSLTDLFKRKETLQNVDPHDSAIENTMITIFDDLAKPGRNGLNRRNKRQRFHVGASKILHFLIPDLFVILDSNARRELAKFHEFTKTKTDGESYFRAMQCYQAELNDWGKRKKDPKFKKLIDIDSSWRRCGGIRTTPLPRIIDKCTFVGNKI